MDRIKRFLTDESGPTAVEYAVMLSLIVGAVMGSVSALASKTAATFNTTSSKLQSTAFGG
jgi:pilus assembly protein Flp/PilA